MIHSWRIVKWVLVLLLILNVPMAVAGDLAPVESVTEENVQPMPEPQVNPNNDSTATQEMSPSDRAARLEQQIINLTQMNLPQQISELRQEVQQLNGRLQVQKHEIQVLSEQQRSFYKDLNHRIQALSGSGTAVSSKPSSNAPQAALNASASSEKMKDSGAYRSAFNLLLKKQYPAAIAGFKAYLSDYPKGAFLANAHYWLGEVYLKQNKTEEAEQSFSVVINQYSASNKVPDAKLKLALIHINLGKKEQGRKELQLVKRQYPGSTAAQLATIQLQRM